MQVHEKQTKGALRNRTILVTRQEEQSEEFISEIEKRGGRAIVVPMIDIGEPESWNACDSALRRVHMYDALVFTSTNAVRSFFSRASATGIDGSVFSSKRIFAVGVRTKEAITLQGYLVEDLPERFSSEALSRQLKSTGVKGMTFLWPKGNLGDSQLAVTLEQEGATVDVVVVYKNTGPGESIRRRLQDLLAGAEIDVVAFASPSAARNFAKIIPPARLARWPALKIAVVGPTTNKEVVDLGYSAHIIARESTVRGLAESIAEFYS